MTNYKEKYESLQAAVALMLVNFRNDMNEDHGRYLLSKWDDIRSKYEDKDDRFLSSLRKWI